MYLLKHKIIYCIYPLYYIYLGKCADKYFLFDPGRPVILIWKTARASVIMPLAAELGTTFGKGFSRLTLKKYSIGGFHMATIDVSGKQVELDDDGYLVDLEQWNKEVAEILAKEDSTELTDAHWEVINFLRDYYEKYQIAPMIKILVKEIGKVMGPEKGNTKYLYELYPAGPAKQACRYAGLPKPTGCV